MESSFIEPVCMTHRDEVFLSSWQTTLFYVQIVTVFLEMEPDAIVSELHQEVPW